MIDTQYNSEPQVIKASSVLVDILQTVITALAITVVIYLFIATPHQVEGESMEPNFYNGELLLTNKVIQWLGGTPIGKILNYDYQRGDVIIFQHTDNIDFIKRIIAGPGDTIKIEYNKVIVNNKVLNEHYIPNTPQFKTMLPSEEASFLQEGVEISVPEGKYFVMGDNRQNSQDSRYKTVQFVDRADIKGKVFFRYWPPGRPGLIQTGTYDENEYSSNKF